MKIWYDWEFLEDGRTIEPISLGMVADDGRELYLINREAPLSDLLDHEWLMANVVPYLPLARKDGFVRVRSQGRNYPEPYWNVDDPDYVTHVRSLPVFREEVRAFLDACRPVELWGYYSAYDHVRLAQLFGPMIDRPQSMPMFTHDLMQLLSHAGLSEDDLPPAPQDAHNALSDARWTRDAYNTITSKTAVIR